MNENFDHANFVQYVTLDNVQQAAVFVQPTPGDNHFTETRVFYDLDSLVNNFRAQLVPKAIAARISNDEKALTNLAGAVWLLDQMVEAKEILLMEAQFALPDAERPDHQ